MSVCLSDQYTKKSNFIFMNIDESKRNKRKNTRKLKGIPTKLLIS